MYVFSAGKMMIRNKAILTVIIEFPRDVSATKILAVEKINDRRPYIPCEENLMIINDIVEMCVKQG